MLDYKTAIEQDLQALLLSKEVEVDVKQEGDLIRFGALIGNGKRGGLRISADLDAKDCGIMFEVVMKMLHAQLVLYAIGCIKEGHRANIDDPFIPNFTATLVNQNPAIAQRNYQNIVGTVASFNLFADSYLNKKNDIKRGRPKTKRD
jgi:hypothetical protein